MELAREFPSAMSMGSPMQPTAVTIVNGIIAVSPRRPRHAPSAPNVESSTGNTRDDERGNTPGSRRAAEVSDRSLPRDDEGDRETDEDCGAAAR
jgi:hypothetical protein